MIRYYFVDKEIYFQGGKMPDRKVKLFNVVKTGDVYLGFDKDGNDYVIHEKDIIIEEE